MYIGQLPGIRLNLFNTVLVLDLSQTSNLNVLAGAVFSIIQRNFPVRFGVVPIATTVDSEIFLLPYLGTLYI
jgi:UDP-glucose:glycoprotein glucosyltransferase